MESKQEYLMKLQLLEQEAGQFGEQLKIINQQVNELEVLKKNIEKIEESKEAEMFSEIGKGIYVKGKLKKEDLLVEVGNKIFVPKSFKDINKIIDNQTDKLVQVKNEIGKGIEQVNGELNKVINDSRKEGKTKGK